LLQGATIQDAPMIHVFRAEVEAGLTGGRFIDITLETGVLMIMGITRIAGVNVLESQATTSPSAVCQNLAFGLLRGLGIRAAQAKKISQAASDEIFASLADARRKA